MIELTCNIVVLTTLNKLITLASYFAALKSFFKGLKNNKGNREVASYKNSTKENSY